MPRDLNIGRQEQKPKTPTCPVCLDTGIVKADGSPRVKTGNYIGLVTLLTQWKPCRICEYGDDHISARERWIRDYALDLPCDTSEVLL